MTDQLYQELPRARRRRVIFWAVLRGVLSAAVLVVLYYVLPLDEPRNGGTAVRVLIGLVVFTGLMVWQVKTIAGSRYPGVKALEALGLIVPFYLLLFASKYFVMERASAASFTAPLTSTDALYFSVTVFSTVGFGDITANPRPPGWCSSCRCSATSRCWAPARVLLGAVNRGRQRRSDTGDDAGRPPGKGPCRSKTRRDV